MTKNTTSAYIKNFNLYHFQTYIVEYFYKGICCHPSDAIKRGYSHPHAVIFRLGQAKQVVQTEPVFFACRNRQSSCQSVDFNFHNTFDIITIFKSCFFG
jgi:hypothetical protein